MQQVGFIGLGSMGAGMTRHLLKAGFSVRAYDVRPELVEAVTGDGAVGCESPAAAADGADLLAVCVFNAEQAEAVLFGEHGAIETLPAGAVVMMHTTLSAKSALALESKLATTGHLLVDAPVTGGKAGADAGTLTIIASGAPDVATTVTAAFDAMGRRTYWVGQHVGAGSTVKMVNQLLVGVHTVAASEAIALAAKAGADPHMVYDVITHGGGNSVSFKTRLPFIFDNDFDPRGVVEIFTKDLGIVSETAADVGASIPLTETALLQFRAAVAAGWGQLDDAAVVKVYEAANDVSITDAIAARADGNDSSEE